MSVLAKIAYKIKLFLLKFNWNFTHMAMVESKSKMGHMLGQEAHREVGFTQLLYSTFLRELLPE